MKHIYSTAASVAIWLGRHQKGSLKESALQALSTETQRDESDSSAPREKRFKKVALNALCNNTYWRRTWMIQELVAAQDLTLHMGGLTAPWLPFSSSVSALLLECPAALIIKLKRSFSAGTTHPLIMLLSECAAHEASDVRGRVYAFLGLAEQGCSVRVEYALEPRDVFLQLMSHTYFFEAECVAVV